MGQLSFPLCQPHPPWAGVNGVSVATYCLSDRFFTRLRRCEPPPPQDVFFDAEGPSGGLRNCASGGPFSPGLPVTRECLRSSSLAAGPGRKSAACGARAISDGPRRVGGGSHRLAGPVASNCGLVDVQQGEGPPPARRNQPSMAAAVRGTVLHLVQHERTSCALGHVVSGCPCVNGEGTLISRAPTDASPWTVATRGVKRYLPAS